VTKRNAQQQHDQFAGSAYAEPEQVLQALGQFLMAWSALDLTLNSLLAALLRTDLVRATIVAQATQGARARAHMLTSLSGYVADEGLQKRIRTIARQYDSLTRRRNQIVHGTLGLSIVINELVVNRWRLGEVVRVHEVRMGPAQISSLNDMVSKIALDVFRLAQDVTNDLRRDDPARRS
jgi:hypothetical protein